MFFQIVEITETSLFFLVWIKHKDLPRSRCYFLRCCRFRFSRLQRIRFRLWQYRYNCWGHTFQLLRICWFDCFVLRKKINRQIFFLRFNSQIMKLFRKVFKIPLNRLARFLNTQPATNAIFINNKITPIMETLMITIRGKSCFSSKSSGIIFSTYSLNAVK